MSSPLDAIRQELKSWENAFKEIYGRKPTKSDVDAAPAKVRTMYREYTKLRLGDRGASSAVEPATKSSGCRLKRDTGAFENPDNQMPSKLERDESRLSLKQSVVRSSADGDQLAQPLCGVIPKYVGQEKTEESDSQGSNQFISYFRSATPDEIALKRRNLCNLALVKLDDCGNEVNDETMSADSNGDEENENGGFENNAETNEEAVTRRTKKRQRGKKSNSNFVQLNMRRRKYVSKSGQRLKGAALKKFIFKKKYQAHRKA